jgi:hypothetical protein
MKVYTVEFRACLEVAAASESRAVEMATTAIIANERFLIYVTDVTSKEYLKAWCPHVDVGKVNAGGFILPTSRPILKEDEVP